MKAWRFTVNIEQDEDDAFIAHCEELPGCWSCGDTETQALENIREAIVGCLRVRLKWAIEDSLKQTPPFLENQPVALSIAYA